MGLLKRLGIHFGKVVCINIPILFVMTNCFPLVAFFLIYSFKVGLISLNDRFDFFLYRAYWHKIRIVLFIEKLHIEIQTISKISMSLLFVGTLGT